MLDATEIRPGSIIRIDGLICKTISQGVAGTGKFGKTIHLKLKNLEEGSILEKSLRAEDRVEEVDVRQVKMQYLYREGDRFIFMDTETYDQHPMNAKIIGKQEIFLKENSEISVLAAGEKLLSVDFPPTAELKVVSTPGGVKGHGENVYKEAELENGLKILVPQFVKEGDRVVVNVEDLSYKERITVKSMKRDKGPEKK